MEEIVGAEAIRDEILDDAKKKAARLLEEAEEEAAKTVAALEAKALAVVEEIMRTSEAKCERFRMETMARFPLERTRMRAVFVEQALRGASKAFFEALPEEHVARLAESMLARGAAYFDEAEVTLAKKGVSEKLARVLAARVLPKAASVSVVEDSALPAPGLVARSAGGNVVVRATMDLVEEKLLDDFRLELARSLCAEALEA